MKYPILTGLINELQQLIQEQQGEKPVAEKKQKQKSEAKVKAKKPEPVKELEETPEELDHDMVIQFAKDRIKQGIPRSDIFNILEKYSEQTIATASAENLVKIYEDLKAL